MLLLMLLDAMSPLHVLTFFSQEMLIAVCPLEHLFVLKLYLKIWILICNKFYYFLFIEILICMRC